MKDLDFKKTYDGEMHGPQGTGTGATYDATVDGKLHKGAVTVWAAPGTDRKAVDDLLRKLGGVR